MHRIEFSRITNGLYNITDHNDERLLCIGQILLSDILRHAVKDTFEYVPEIGMVGHKDVKTEEYHLHMSPKDQSTIWLKLHTKGDPEHILEIDMDINTMLDIIDDWEDAIDAMPESIIMNRAQDTYTIETV